MQLTVYLYISVPNTCKLFIVINDKRILYRTAVNFS